MRVGAPSLRLEPVVSAQIPDWDVPNWDMPNLCETNRPEV
jgi:hypothetical protein